MSVDIDAIRERIDAAIDIGTPHLPDEVIVLLVDAERLCGEVERLCGEVEQLRRWKAEARIVMHGLDRLGRVVGAPLGTSITDSAIECVERLTSERDEARGQVARVESLAVKWNSAKQGDLFAGVPLTSDEAEMLLSASNDILRALDGPQDSAHTSSDHSDSEGGAA